MKPIPVDHQLPPRCEDDTNNSHFVLCWTTYTEAGPEGEWVTGYYDFDAGAWDTTDGWARVTHWLPLPPAPGQPVADWEGRVHELLAKKHEAKLLLWKLADATEEFAGDLGLGTLRDVIAEARAWIAANQVQPGAVTAAELIRLGNTPEARSAVRPDGGGRSA